MPDDCRNIYKTCRKAAGFTQEAAAERLGVCGPMRQVSGYHPMR